MIQSQPIERGPGETLVMKDVEGTTRLMLKGTSAGPAIGLFGVTGRVAAGMVFQPLGTQLVITLYSRKGKPRVAVVIDDDDEPLLFDLNPAGEPIAMRSAFDDSQAEVTDSDVAVSSSS